MDEILQEKTVLAESIWQQFAALHPADIARFFEDINKDEFQNLYMRLPKNQQLAVFKKLSDKMKATILAHMDDQQRAEALHSLHADELADLFDLLSDKELEHYLLLITQKVREKVLSLLKFPPESAGGIMDVRVMTLTQDFTVAQSVKLLQRLSDSIDIYQQIYVTDADHKLVGYINLEDLVLQKPDRRISEFMHKNEFIANVNVDRERVAHRMVHYGLMSAPVVTDDKYFLGVIPSESLVDVIVEEASEDIQKISALSPMKHTYFETSFGKLLFQRSGILIVLLIAESAATNIMESYEQILTFGSLLYFTTMLISAGGNTSNQTSAIVIQGLASGEIRESNIFRFLRREFAMAGVLALILGGVSFARAFISTHHLLQSVAISLSLASIVLVSVVLGSCIPLILRRLKIDPAFSAGPFLATLMDILGVLMYCIICKLVLSSLM